jgi:hypothetical protein
MKQQDKFRIRKADKDNWVVERFEAGGGIAQRGRTAGQPKAARWVVDGYYNQIKFAAIRLTDTILGDILEGQENITGKEILAAITQAEARALKIIEDAVATQPKAG